MVEPKMSLILTLPGSIKVNYQETTFMPIKQVIKMSKDAYEAMISEPSNPKYNKIVAKSMGKAIRVWDTMSKDARIKKHCEMIKHDMHAVDFDFIIFED